MGRNGRNPRRACFPGKLGRESRACSPGQGLARPGMCGFRQAQPQSRAGNILSRLGCWGRGEAAGCYPQCKGLPFPGSPGSSRGPGTPQAAHGPCASLSPVLSALSLSWARGWGGTVTEPDPEPALRQLRSLQWTRGDVVQGRADRVNTKPQGSWL